ncbi:MAG TPA: AsmA family protein [Burkholderiales bacterium]|nr:AsmA family protein [Burkholderiales bacterium]
MNKPIKYVLFVLGGLVVLLAGVAVVFALTFNPNRYKDDIERIAKERTGRTLKLQGELKLALFPSLGATVAGVTLSERGSDREFVALDSAHASVKLMPLLHGQAIVDAVRLSGLKAQVVKNKDGTYNFSDLLEGGAAKPAAKPAPEKKGESAPVKFDITGISVDRASILHRDLNSGQEISLTDVKLHTGRIAENVQDKIDLAAAVKRNQPPLEAKVALNGTYSLKPDAIGLDFTAKLDESSVKGKLAMARAAQPSYSFDLTIDRINLDRYLASSGKKKPEAGKQEPPKKEEAAKDAPVDLSGLKGLNAKGQLQVGALQVQGLKLSNLKAQLKAADGRAEINPHSASLYEGELTGALTLDGNANRIALKETLTNVSVGPLLRDAAQQDRLEGRGNVALDVTAAGASVNTMKRSLAGSAKVQLRDGAIKGINIAEILRKARAAVGKQSGEAADSKDKTDFSELSASFTIKNGVAHNEDLDIKSPLLRIGGAGDIDVGRSAINYVVKASVVATAKGQGGKELDKLAGLTVPVKLSGSFDALKYEVDYRAVAGDLAKTKVGEKVKGQIEQNKDKIQDQVKDRLKGLIGR